MNDIHEQWVADLNGTNAYMVFEQALPNIHAALSVELWAKSKAPGPKDNDTWIAMAAGGRDFVYVLRGWGDKLYWDAPWVHSDHHNYDRIERSISKAEHCAGWVHWAFTKDARSGQSIIYRDGALWHRGQDLHRTLTETLDRVFVGARSQLDRFWAAQVTELRVWDHARTADELAEAKNTRLRGDEPGLAAYWPLCEGRGQVLYTGLSQQALQGTGHNLGWQIAALPLAPADPALTCSGSLHYWQTWRRHQEASAPPLRRGRIR